MIGCFNIRYSPSCMNMTNKTYKLKNLEDIVKAVKEENTENFIRDFTGWLGLHIGIEKEIKNLLEGVELIRNYTMTWIDDGKNDAKITIIIKNES